MTDGVIGVGGNSDSTWIARGDLKALLDKVIVQAIEDLPEFIDEIALTEHEADTTEVHGIPDTSKLAIKEEIAAFATAEELVDAINELTAADTEIQELLEDAIALKASKAELSTEKSERETADAAKASKTELSTEKSERETADAAKASKTELSTHEADTSSVHGISDTTKLATTSSVGVMSSLVGCQARKTVNQTITKEVVTVLSWSETTYDDGDCWQIGQPTRFTVPANQGGLYSIQWTTTILPSGLSGEKEIWFRLNGDEKLRIATQDFVGPADMQTLTATVRLNAGDYVECCAYLETTENGQFADDEYNTADDLQRIRFERIR